MKIQHFKQGAIDHCGPPRLHAGPEPQCGRIAIPAGCGGPVVKYPDGFMFGGSYRGLELIQQQALGFMRDIAGNPCPCLFQRKGDQAFSYRAVHSLATAGPSFATDPYIHSSRPVCF